MLFITAYLFKTDEVVRDKWQKRLEYIMIDEFQDIDKPQIDLMNLLIGTHKNLFVVGDPDQTIYSWRGADERFLMRFADEHPPCETIFMNENYRSRVEILNVANCLIENNGKRIKKELLPMRSHGPRVLCHHAKNNEAEALWVAEKIKALLSEGIALSDIALLYRAHYVTRSFEEAFRKAELPYAIYSGVNFFDRAEIKDALSYLRMIALKDDLAFRRIVNMPKRNIGDRRRRFLEEHTPPGETLYRTLQSNIEHELFKGTGAADFVALIERFSREAEGMRVSDLLNAILIESGYEQMLRTEGAQERLDNLAELKQSVYDYEISCGEEAQLTDYLQHVALYTDADQTAQGGKLKLMTVHAAKGLEFPIVFLVGMNEGIFPTRKTQTLDGMEEERRLCFVAITRAKEQLFLTEAEGRTFDGAPRYPSRFILETEAEIDYTAPIREELISEARRVTKKAAESLALAEADTLPVGTRVRHAVFGEGTITAVDKDLLAYEIHFLDRDMTRAISFHVSLEVVS